MPPRALPAPPTPRSSSPSARLTHDIPRSITASTGTWYLPARAPRTAHAALLLPIHARLAPPHRRKYGDTKPPRTLLVPPTPRSSSPSTRASLMTSPAASPRVQGQDTTPPPHASRSAGAVLSSPYPGPPPQCPPNPSPPPPCAPKPPLPPPYATLRAEMNEG
ncbi:hypothetical protein DFH09DRAFT_1320877 [Mycena vulgaris]|nr:hypothetical protein DFH09DRAFT_1320877 [Mycena vulgaris]